MFKIDIHTHILPKHLPDFAKKFGYGGFVQIGHKNNCSAQMLIDGNFFRKIESNIWEPLERIKDCDRHNVDVQVLSTVPVMFSYWAKPEHGLQVAEYLNDHIAGIVEKLTNIHCFAQELSSALETGNDYCEFMIVFQKD